MTTTRLKQRLSPRLAPLVTPALCGLIMVAACAPTVRLQVDPIQISAKLDADVRVRLDRELEELLRENPNLF